MNSHAFALNLIENNTILDYETFTERAIQAVLANELTQEKFIGALDDFNSFEGLDNQFCVNFTGAWLKYALGGSLSKDKLNSHKLIRNILGDQFEEKEMVGGAAHHLISDEMYRKVNWNEDSDSIEDYSDQLLYVLKKCMKHRANNSTRELNIILMRPDDFLDIITS